MNLFLSASINLEMLATIATIAIVVGVILGIIELCIPGFGIFGTVGIILCIAGVILRIIANQSMLVTTIILVAICIFFAAAFLVVGHSAKSGRLSKTALVSTETAVPIGKTQGTEDYSSFHGKIGETTTELRPVGKARFEGETLEVISSSQTMISCGKKVQVVYIEGGKVLVEEI